MKPQYTYKTETLVTTRMQDTSRKAHNVKIVITQDFDDETGCPAYYWARLIAYVDGARLFSDVTSFFRPDIDPVASLLRDVENHLERK